MCVKFKSLWMRCVLNVKYLLINDMNKERAQIKKTSCEGGQEKNWNLERNNQKKIWQNVMRKPQI